MKNLSLLSVAVVLLTCGVASAQSDKPAEGAAPAPAAIQNAPPDKIAPSMQAGQPNAETHKTPETVGQQPQASDAGKTRATDKVPNDSTGTAPQK